MEGLKVVVDNTPEAYKPKRVIKSKFDGVGYIAKLECGHRVWTAIDPADLKGWMYCGACLRALAETAKAG